ncbi:hypothetical protein [Cerasicoccus frondis]|uniref:hypothetical protein n=1 Tax=Cerasicoccus frondis TaxID=490090 RepID=UPI002852834A|nr:hypothetical protein [Cerasicoccus frondis]
MKINLKHIVAAIALACASGSAIAEQVKNILPYGACEQGKLGWYVWSKAGSIELETDRNGLGSGKGLKIIAQGDAVNASVSMPFNYQGRATISALVECDTIDTTKVVLQCFNYEGQQIAWIDLAHLNNDGRVTQIKKTVTIPDGSHKVNLALIFSSPGTLRIDDIVVTPAPVE